MEKEIQAAQPEATELQNLRDEVKHLEETVRELTQPETSTSNGNMVLLVVVLIALISLLIATYFLFLRAPKKDTPATITPVASTTLATATTTATATPITIEVYKDNKPWYDVSIEYPNLPVAKDFIMNKYNSFTEDTKILQVKNQAEAKEVLGLMNPDWRYTFNSTVTTASSTNTTSYIFEAYTFTGGAHGSTDISALTLNTEGKIIPVTEIIQDKYLTKISQIAKQQITTEKKKRLINSGMTKQDIDSILNYDEMMLDGLKPVRENYSVAWVDGDEIVVHFGQYQVGAYAEGMYNVRIKRNLLE